MTRQFEVHLEKRDMVFSAAHFITFNGNVCERLHGHNYGVAVDVYGELDENQYVIDFIALRDSLQEIVTQLDHHVLLPTNHPMIHVSRDEAEVTARFEQRRWVFPTDDCVLLPVANTTAELLAEYIAGRLLEILEHRTGARPQEIRVAVDENRGQWGVFRSKS